MHLPHQLLRCSQSLPRTQWVALLVNFRCITLEVCWPGRDNVQFVFVREYVSAVLVDLNYHTFFNSFCTLRIAWIIHYLNFKQRLSRQDATKKVLNRL